MNQQLHTTEDIAQLIEVAPDIVVTIIENATVFEGPESVYRYDLPAAGIREGWAVQAVIDQIALMLGGTWPDVEVAVDAQPEVAAVIVEALLGKGVGAYRAEVERQAPPAEGEETSFDRPADNPSFLQRFEPLRGISPVIVAGAVLVVAIVVLAWWLLAKVVATPPQPPGTPALVAKEQSSVSNPPTTAGGGTGEVSPSPEQDPFNAEQVLLEHDQIRVQLPTGYRLEGRGDGMVTAVGPDPNLRILLSAEFVGQLPGEHVASEVHHMIEQDPTLSASSPTGVGRGEPELAYLEDPGDGSQVTWSVWMQDGNVYSVGCHSKAQPTLSHKAACRMAAASVDRIDES